MLSHAGRTILLATGVSLCVACAPMPSRDAPTTQGQVREEPPLRRAERLLDAGRVFDAEEMLAHVDTDELSPRDVHRFRLLRSELSLAAGQPLFALRDLPPPDSTPDRALAARTEALRADVFLAMEDVAEAISALVRRAELLDDADEWRRNNETIWRTLLEYPLGGGVQSRFAGADRLTRGWLELALIARGAVPGRRDALLRDWRARFPDHPGSRDMAEQAMAERIGGGWARVEQGGDIAVLLPDHGPLGPISNAVRAAMMAAWEMQPAPRPNIRFYDSGDYPDDARRAVDHAVRDGASLIIGPLRRSHVNALAQYGPLPVPVLALNYLDDDVRPPFNLFRFGLAPEDEARAAVLRNSHEGTPHLLAMITEADWSERVLYAIAEEAERSGGKLLSSRRIHPDIDFSEPVRGLLNVDASEARHRELSRILGSRPEFEPRARQDAGALLVIARQREAVQVVPRVAFHGAPRLPIYLTALAWDGELPVPRELHGSRICDMPWMMRDEEAPWLFLRAQLEADFADTFARLPRMFALGHDAMLLALRLQQGWEPGIAFPGASGVLELDPSGRIARQLGCATLAAEGATPLPPIVTRPDPRAFGLEDDEDRSLRPFGR